MTTPNWPPSTACQVTNNQFFRTLTEEILDYAVCGMTDPVGGFSSQDADPTPLRSGDVRTEGEEGKFFAWTPDAIHRVLDDEADAFMAANGVTQHGSFEGKNIPEFAGDMGQRPTLAEAHRKLFEARKKRVHPRPRRGRVRHFTVGHPPAEVARQHRSR